MASKLIAGLGNPGPRYERTRHNAGFMAVDFLLESFSAKITGMKHGSQFARIRALGHDLVFIKPMLYMNLSGEPVYRAMEAFGIKPEELLVMHDDLDIPLGEARYKIGGGHAGHNGLRSIIEETGSSEFNRIRIGVGRPPERISVTDHVLGEFEPEEIEPFQASLKRAAELLEDRFLG